MKAYRLEKPGGIDCLDLVDIPIPSPTTGEVLVRINAVSLNYRDLITVNGGYGSWQKRPLIPTSDSAGVVEAIGPGVKRFKIGDRVINGFLPN